MNRRELIKTLTAATVGGAIGAKVIESVEAQAAVRAGELTIVGDDGPEIIGPPTGNYPHKMVYTSGEVTSDQDFYGPKITYLKGGEEIEVTWLDKYSFVLKKSPDEFHWLPLYSRGEVEKEWFDSVGQKAIDYELALHIVSIQRLYDKLIAFGGVNEDNYTDWQQYVTYFPY